jgi:DNA helicase IV
MPTRTDAAEDQAHFDVAWEARERTRNNHTNIEPAHGNKKDVRAIRAHAASVLEKLGDPDTAVAVGRLDMESGEVLYVGKHAITSDDRDVLVVNWKLPIIAPFYKASARNAYGAASTRKFECDRNKILWFEETVFAALAEQVEALQHAGAPTVDDVLLSELDATRDGRLREIVQTIHAAQYDLIELPLATLLIVQGGPGTGKSVVALHRASYLLYNNQKALTPSDILVVGPNKTFTTYIRRLLPDLGDDGVEHRDLRGLGPIRSDAREEPDDVARLKGDARMAKLLRAGLHQRVGLAGTTTELVVRQPYGSISINRAEVEAQVGVLLGKGSHGGQREQFRAWLTSVATQRLNGARPEAEGVEAAVERVWPRLSPAAFLQDLLGSRDRLILSAGEHFSAADVTRLHRQAEKRVSDETWSDADVALLDEAERLLQGREKLYGHIVVDEAQDLSPMQLRSIRSRSKYGSMTIVGDLAQSTGHWARDSWDDVSLGLRGAGAVPALHELEYGYRVPREAFEFAAQLMPHIAPGIRPPQVIREVMNGLLLTEVDHEDLVDRAADAAQAQAALGRSVGLVCSGSVHEDLRIVLRHRGVQFTDVSSGSLGKTINLLTADQSKGLEFDAVVVADPAGIASEDDQTGLRHLFIALTRTTQHLSVVWSEPVRELGLGSPPLLVEPGLVDELADIRSDAEAADLAVEEPAATSAPAFDLVGMIVTNLADQIRRSVSTESREELIQRLSEELRGDEP